MADEIIQQLGFDASAALEALSALDGGLGNFAQTLKTVGDAMTGWNSQAGATVQILKDIAANATSAAGAMSKLASAFSAKQAAMPAAGKPLGPNDVVAGAGFPPAADQAAQQVKTPLAPVEVPIKPTVDSTPITQATKETQNFVMSWETLGRVVTTQLIVRAMSEIRNALGEAYAANVQFVKSLSEIQAIAPAQSLDSLRDSAVALSREFNIPINQVVEAQYQAISNQFDTTAKMTDVLTAAAKASKVGLVDMGKATEIVAGALNVYGQESTEAEAITAKMFKAVGEGHIRFGDLANVISRVGPTARELGVSFDELLAAVDALSIGGMKPAEVATALRASMTALFKPSRDLRQELQGLSSEQMIAVNGLIGSWAKLRGDTNGTIAELAKLVGNIRGMNAVMRETGTGAAAFANSLQNIKQAGTGSLNAAVAGVQSTDVAKVTAEMNKLHLYLTTDLGADVVKLLEQFANLTGGADTVISVLKGLEPVALAAAGAFLILAANLMYVKANAALATAGLGTLTGALSGLLVVGAAVAGGNIIGDRFVSRQQEVVEQLSQLERKVLSDGKAADEERMAATKAKNDEIVRSSLAMVSKVGEAYHQQVAQAKDSAHQWGEDTKAGMESLVTARERGVRLLRDLAAESNREIENSHKRTVETAGRLDDAQFRSYEANNALSFEKASDYAGRAYALAQKAHAALSTAATPQDREAAQSIYKRAEAFAQESAQMASRSRDILERQNAEIAVFAVMKSELDAERQLQEMERDRADAAAKAAAAEEAKTQRMRNLLKDILKEGNPFDTKGEPLPDAKRQDNLQKMQKDMGEFQKLAFSSDKWQMSDLLNFAGFKQKMETAFKESTTDLQIQNVRLAADKMKTLNQQLTHGIGIVDVLVNLVPDKSKLKGLTADQALINAREQIQQQGTEVDKLNQKKSQSLQLEREAVLEAAKMSAIFEMSDSWQSNVAKALGTLFSRHTLGDARGGGPAEAQEELARAAALRQEVEKAAQDASFGLQQYNELAARAAQAYASSSNSSVVQFDALAHALEVLQRIATLHDQIQNTKATGNLDEEIKGAQQKVDALKQGTPAATDAAQGLLNKVGQTQTTVQDLSMESFIGQIDRAIERMRTLAATAASVASTGGRDMTAAHGGMAFLADGGRPRGTDVIPAMLSPGEMVMSATTTRRFASQLTAMNAGTRPSYHSQGGHVTNVGDINVTVQAGGTGHQTARTIANELRRELRRGSSTLD